MAAVFRDIDLSFRSQFWTRYGNATCKGTCFNNMVLVMDRSTHAVKEKEFSTGPLSGNGVIGYSKLLSGMTLAFTNPAFVACSSCE